MTDSLPAALESMLTLQRWNSLPRVETWVEAENAAYVTHLAYALGRATGLTQPELECVLLRALLKSLNKHSMTDIAVPVREKLKAKNLTAWTALVDEIAKRTAAFFPRRISSDLLPFLTDAPGYKVGATSTKAKVTRIENLVKFAQLHAAIEECKANKITYAAEYSAILDDLTAKRDAFPEATRWRKLVNKHNAYFRTIRRLKCLRRWNRISRIVPSTVLGHTYVVCVLSLVFAKLSEEKHEEDGSFQYLSILRALFHDLPESVTGDIIAPVKDIIAGEDSKLVETVETELTKEFLAGAPIGVRDDLDQYTLLKEITNRKTYSSSSLVKDCDRLALLLECIYERATGMSIPEMTGAYQRYQQELSRSEWSPVREFATVLSEYWHGAS